MQMSAINGRQNQQNKIKYTAKPSRLDVKHTLKKIKFDPDMGHSHMERVFQNTYHIQF